MATAEIRDEPNLYDRMIKAVEEKITEVEEEIKKLSLQIDASHDAAQENLLRVEKEQLREELYQLREEKIKLIEQETKRMEKESKLTEKETKLLEKENLLLKSHLKGQALDTGPFQTGETGPSLTILTYDKYIGTCASGFVASCLIVPGNCAFNGMCAESFNTPDIVKVAINQVVTIDIQKEAETVIRAGFLFTINPIKVHETGVHGEKRTVTGTAGVALKQFFEDRTEHLSSHFTMELSSMNADIGPASDGSKPDLVCAVTTGHYRQVGLLVCELKDTAFCPLEMLGQAFVSAANLVITQIQIGLLPSEVAIPLILSTGNMMQFAWATTLDPLFPVLNVTSRMFDISVADDIREASRALAKAKMFCREQAVILRQRRVRDDPLPMAPVVPSLNSDLYHLKGVRRIFNRYDDDDCIGDVGLAYLWNVFEALKDIEEAVKPLGYATTMKDRTPEKCLIFPKLGASFRMGVPEDERQFKEYITALSNVVKRQHQKLVVHVDLYPSNILWDLFSDSIRIRIVDWDAATFIGDAFTTKVRNVFVSEGKRYYYWKDSHYAEPQCDAWFVFILSHLNEAERQGMQGDANKVNKAYQSAVERQSKGAGGREALVQQYENWFMGWDSGGEAASEKLNLGAEIAI
jgi:hypothetical protein